MNSRHVYPVPFGVAPWTSNSCLGLTPAPPRRPPSVAFCPCLPCTWMLCHPAAPTSLSLLLSHSALSSRSNPPAIPSNGSGELTLLTTATAWSTTTSHPVSQLPVTRLPLHGLCIPHFRLLSAEQSAQPFRKSCHPSHSSASVPPWLSSPSE